MQYPYPEVLNENLEILKVGENNFTHLVTMRQIWNLPIDQFARILKENHNDTNHNYRLNRVKCIQLCFHLLNDVEKQIILHPLFEDIFMRFESLTQCVTNLFDTYSEIKLKTLCEYHPCNMEYFLELFDIKYHINESSCSALENMYHYFKLFQKFKLDFHGKMIINSVCLADTISETLKLMTSKERSEICLKFSTFLETFDKFQFQLQLQLELESDCEEKNIKSIFGLPLKLVGKGCYGLVYKIPDINIDCRHKSDCRDDSDGSSSWSALKIYSKSSMKDYVDIGINNIMEIDILCRLHHPCLMYIKKLIFEDRTCYKYFDNPKLKFLIKDNTFGIIMPFVNSNLFEVDTQQLSFYEIVNIIFNLASCVLYLHQNNILHLDIKSTNVLYDSKTKKIYLTDFGLSKHTDTKIVYSEDSLITWTYRPPTNFSSSSKEKSQQICQEQSRIYYKKPSNVDIQPHLKYEEASDVWSIGILFLILIINDEDYIWHLEKMYHDDKNDDNDKSDSIEEKSFAPWMNSLLKRGKLIPYLTQIISGKRLEFENNKELFDQIMDLLGKIFTQMPEDRIKLSDFLKHPIFSLCPVKVQTYDEFCTPTLMDTSNASNALELLNVETITKLPKLIAYMIKVAIRVFPTYTFEGLFLGVDLVYRTLSLMDNVKIQSNIEESKESKEIKSVENLKPGLEYEQILTCLFIGMKYYHSFIKISKILEGSENEDITFSDILKMEIEIMKKLDGIIHHPFLWSQVRNAKDIIILMRDVISNPKVYFMHNVHDVYDTSHIGHNDNDDESLLISHVNLATLSVEKGCKLLSDIDKYHFELRNYIDL